MKRISLFLVTAWVFAPCSHATDRVVSPSGSYNTITAAIAASSDGDRILVEPNTYNESITLSKSLSILSNQEGSRFTLNGAVILDGADGKTITLSGARVLDAIVSAGSYTSRTEFRFMDSYTRYCSVAHPLIHLALYRDTLTTYVQFSSGDVIGNVIYGKSPETRVVKVTGATTLPDPIRVIGNEIGSAGMAAGSKPVEVNSTAQFVIENNFIKHINGGSGGCLVLTEAA